MKMFNEKFATAEMKQAIAPFIVLSIAKVLEDVLSGMNVLGTDSCELFCFWTIDCTVSGRTETLANLPLRIVATCLRKLTDLQKRT